MNAVFADTFYWIAMTNLQDLAHEKAKAFSLSTTPGASLYYRGSFDRVLELLRRLGPEFSA